MKDVRIQFSLKCQWELLPPGFRIYFNDELITERDYYADNKSAYFFTMFVEANKGHHILSLEPLEPKNDSFEIEDFVFDSYENEDLNGIQIKCQIR